MRYKIKKAIAFLMVCAMVAAISPQRVVAAEEGGFGYEIVIAPTPAVIGRNVVLTVKLTDYDESKPGITGFQIDINNSGEILQNAVCKTLVTDNANTISNTAAYQPKRDIVRHLYAKLSGTMAYDQTELVEVTIPIPDTFTEAGTISLPFRLLIGDEKDGEYTYNSTIDINYVPAGEEPDVSVDLAWGAMDFTYTDGAWNPNTHTFADGSWTANGDSNQVTVTNSGTADVKVRFDYNSDRTDIAGAFSNGENVISGAVTIPADTAKTCYLLLKGRPRDKVMENAVIGQVTVSLE